MTILYVIGFIVLMAFLLVANYKMEAAREKREQTDLKQHGADCLK